jgi:hypothetical protein
MTGTTAMPDQDGSAQRVGMLNRQLVPPGPRA